MQNVTDVAPSLHHQRDLELEVKLILIIESPDMNIINRSGGGACR